MFGISNRSLSAGKLLLTKDNGIHRMNGVIRVLSVFINIKEKEVSGVIILMNESNSEILR